MSPDGAFMMTSLVKFLGKVRPDARTSQNSASSVSFGSLPTRSRYACFVPVPLDAGKMDEGSKALLGEHDFKSFCSVHTQAESTVRTVTDIGVERRENEIVICVKGTGFLYNMVRIIAGTLIEVGRGKIQPGEVKEILDAADRRKAGPTAKPRGLCLEDIRFMDEDHTGEPI